MKGDSEATGWHWLLLLAVHQARCAEEEEDQKHVARVQVAVLALTLAGYREARGKRASAQPNHVRTDHV